MGCFIACFGCTKKRKRIKSGSVSLPHDAAQRGLRRSYEPLESASGKLDVKESSSCREAVADLNRKEKAAVGSRTGKKVSFNLNVRTYELISSEDRIEEIKQEATTAYPSSYRYKNYVDCQEVDDEDDEDEEEDSLEEFDESDHSIEEKGVLGMNHHDRFGIAHSVLSPVENIAQWRAVKVMKAPSAQSKQPLCKENVALGNRVCKSMQQEISVDASLSNWINGNGRHNAVLKAPLLRTI